MADVLTQLQEQLERLSHQFTASINYIDLHAPLATLETDYIPPAPTSPPATAGDPSQPTSTTQTQTQSQAPTNSNSSTSQPHAQASNQQPDAAAPADGAPAKEPTHWPDSPPTFAANKQELAEDILKKTAQIVELIEMLPGLGRSQEAQEARIRELEEEMRAVEAERRLAVGERERAIEVLEGVIAGVRR